MRKEFELTEQQLAMVLDASKPTMVIFGSGGVPLTSTPQENANYVWRTLGSEMGFVWDTARPVADKGQRFFTAEVTAHPPAASAETE